MNSSQKGNRPELWERLLEVLDEKLQLGLLDHLRRVHSYHFEDDNLYIVPGSTLDEEYLRRDATFHQLQIFAQDIVKVDRVKIKSFEDEVNQK